MRMLQSGPGLRFTSPVDRACAGPVLLRCEEAAVTAQPLAPVIPSSGLSAARRHARSAARRRPLPLARPVPVPSAPEDVVYGIGRIDASGRIADRTVISALVRAGSARSAWTRRLSPGWPTGWLLPGAWPEAPTPSTGAWSPSS